MKIKSVFPEQRSRPVDGVPIGHLRELVAQAKSAEWHNGSDILQSFSVKELARRLAAMPDGCEVVVMAGPNKSVRRFPVPTNANMAGDCLVISTHYCY